MPVTRTSLLTLLLAAACAVAALPADAANVVPEQVTPLTDAVNQGKDQLAKGDYAAASASVRQVPVQAKLVSEFLGARKAALAATLDTLSAAMPRNLAAIKAKLDSIGKPRTPTRRGLPNGPR
jgi:hypothetical protein